MKKTITSLPPFQYLNGLPPRPRIVSPASRRDGLGAVDVGEAVVYRDDKTGRMRRVRVVATQETDHTNGDVSTTSPLGAALVGLGIGDRGEWRDRQGNNRVLHVVHIEDEIEPVGYLNF